MRFSKPIPLGLLLSFAASLALVACNSHAPTVASFVFLPSPTPGSPVLTAVPTNTPPPPTATFTSAPPTATFTPPPPTATFTPQAFSATPTFTSDPGTPTASFTPSFTRTPTLTPTQAPPTATSTLTGTSTWTGTPTNTFTPVPMGIYWERAYVSKNVSGVPSAFLYLAVNGYPESTAGVTLLWGSNSAPMTYNGTTNISGTIYAVYRQDTLTYQAGTTYTLAAVTSAGTAVGTCVAPGGITVATDGSNTSWLMNGNQNTYIQVTGPSPGTTTTYSTYASVSPAAIPTSTAYPTTGTYQVWVSVDSVVYGGSGITNSPSQSYFVVRDDLYQNVVK